MGFVDNPHEFLLLFGLACGTTFLPSDSIHKVSRQYCASVPLAWCTLGIAQ